MDYYITIGEASPYKGTLSLSMLQVGEVPDYSK